MVPMFLGMRWRVRWLISRLQRWLGIWGPSWDGESVCQEAKLVRDRKSGTVQAGRVRRAQVVGAVLTGVSLARTGPGSAGSRRASAGTIRPWSAPASPASSALSRRSSARRNCRWLSAGACSGWVEREQCVSDTGRVPIAQGRVRRKSAAAIALFWCGQTISLKIARNTSLTGSSGPRRCAAAHPDNKSMRICHEQIYQALRLQGAGCLRQQLRVDKALRSGRTWRLPRLVLNG